MTINPQEPHEVITNVEFNIYIFISDILIRIAGRLHSTHCVPLDMLSRGGKGGHEGLDKQKVFVCTLVVKAEGGSTSTGNIHSSTVLLKNPERTISRDPHSLESIAFFIHYPSYDP